jgi:hypothetical protein
MMQKLNFIKNKQVSLCLNSLIIFNKLKMFKIIYNKKFYLNDAKIKLN